MHRVLRNATENKKDLGTSRSRVLIFFYSKMGCQLRFYADLEQPLEPARNSSQRLHCSRRARMYSFIIYNSSSPRTVIQRKPENAGLVGESDESTFDFISWKTD